MHRIRSLEAVAGMILAASLACATPPRGDGGAPGAEPDQRAEAPRSDEHVRPGITVLLDDSIHLVRGKRVGLLTNQTGVDEHGTSDIDLLASDPRAHAAGTRLVSLFAPEHGMRGTEDRENVADGVDARTGLVIHSLYGASTIAPPDSTLRALDVLVFDLQDIGTRTWTYVGNLVYALRAARRNGTTLIVLDRPAPLTGVRRDGPMLQPALANAQEAAPGRPALPYALHPFPLRHGMTMGEMARFYNEELAIGADLHVVPASGWRRAMWFDETGLPWVRPSPNLPSLTSALLYPSLVALEGSNVSVGRGTSDAFQRFGAPWLHAREVVALLEDRELKGVRFAVDSFTPHDPGDRKYDGLTIPGVRIVVTDRDRVQAGRLCAAIVWAIARTAGDSLRVNALSFDRRFGNPAAREALLRGDDPDGVIDADLPGVVEFENRARRYLLYR